MKIFSSTQKKSDVIIHLSSKNESVIVASPTGEAVEIKLNADLWKLQICKVANNVEKRDEQIYPLLKQ